MRRTFVTLATLAATLLAGCDMLGIDTPEKVAATREADGKAIGGACRHAGRAIEDCFALNKKADRAAVFAGWRDMNDYMRENKIEAVAPQLTARVSPRLTGEGADAGPADKAADKSTDKASADKAEKGAEKAADKATEKAADKGEKADKAGAKSDAKPESKAAKSRES